MYVKWLRQDPRFHKLSRGPFRPPFPPTTTHPPPQQHLYSPSINVYFNLLYCTFTNTEQFHFNDHFAWFYPQTQTLALHFSCPYFLECVSNQLWTCAQNYHPTQMYWLVLWGRNTWQNPEIIGKGCQHITDSVSKMAGLCSSKAWWPLALYICSQVTRKS